MKAIPLIVLAAIVTSAMLADLADSQNATTPIPAHHIKQHLRLPTAVELDMSVPSLLQYLSLSMQISAPMGSNSSALGSGYKTSKSAKSSKSPKSYKSKSDKERVTDLNPPVCISDDSIINFEGSANDNETGIAGVTLVDGAENLNLTIDSLFVSGDENVTFKATRLNDTLPAAGTILVMDQVGSNCTLNVTLEPFDFGLLDEQAGLPVSLHQDLFGAPSAEDFPVYDTEAVLLEAPGIYPATNEDNTSFFIQVSSIVIPSEDIIATIVEDGSQELVDAIAAENFSSFAFRGFFHFDGTSIEVIALAYSVASTMISNVVVIYDPNSADLFGITDATDEVELEPPSELVSDLPLAPGRRLQEAETSFPPSLGGQLALMPYEGRALLESCSNALSEAIEAANCEPPEQPYVNQPCVSTATFVFNQAVAAARGEYDRTIRAAKAAYTLWMIKVNRDRIRDFAKALIPCVLIGVLSGPLGYALCAARALAIAVAKAMAAQLAGKAILEAAERNAETTLRLALFAACNTFRGTLFACVRCVTCGNPDQQPCGDACYDPATQKCCPEEAIAAKDACCPNEKSCPDGSCIPQDSCCPEEKPCNGGCIPKKDCCPSQTSRKMLRAFDEDVASRRKLEEDPCCTNPDDECCGSDDPCCGSDDPCCGSGDPCCGSEDPCCGSSNSCCGKPDCGGSSGDPHMTTFDGLRYDCQGRGEFVLVAAGNTTVQARFKKRGRVAVTSGVAITEGPESTKVEISLGVESGGPVLVVSGAVISPPSLGYEDSNVIVVSISGSDSGPFRITYKSSTLSIFVRTYPSFGRYLNLNVGLPRALRDLGTVGLLGSADNDPTNDWMMPNGTVVPIPPSRSGRVGLTSLNYCLDNWCVDDAASSLFTYYEQNYDFDFFSGCNDLDKEVVDISAPPFEAVKFCGVDEACLVDFIEGGQDVAKETLVETAELDAVFTTGSLVANPATIPVNQSVNVALSIDASAANDVSIDEFALYRVDSVTGEQNGESKVLVLADDNEVGVFTGSINVFLTEAGEAFGFRAIPVIGGEEAPTSPLAILRLVTVRSFSDESGIADDDNDGTGLCPEPCDDGNLCTIDFCLNSVCRTEPVACEIGQKCDPFSGRCQDIENLVPCVAVIDEWNNRAYNNEWATFRERFPQRPFCLLVPRSSVQRRPTGFDLDTVNNPDGIDRTVSSTVNRDNGNSASASDWLSICGLDSLTPENVNFVGLFVDDSGSMRVATVRASLDVFESEMADRGVEIRRVVNSAERWIDPFLTDLAPENIA